jgi:beta-phosphoglucomutase
MRAAIFDFDGVLVNSEPLHFSALRSALAETGIGITRDEYDQLYLAYDDRGAIRLAFEHHGRAIELDRLHEVALRKAEIFEELLPTVPLFPGAAALVRTLAREVPLAIASGARREEIEAILEGGGLRDAFQAIVGADDVTRGKPDPEPYLRAAARLLSRVPDLKPEECVAFEDSMPGIAAARSAGMRVVAVTNSYPAEKLRAAHRVVTSLEEVDRAGLTALFAA